MNYSNHNYFLIFKQLTDLLDILIKSMILIGAQITAFQLAVHKIQLLVYFPKLNNNNKQINGLKFHELKSMDIQ